MMRYIWTIVLIICITAFVVYVTLDNYSVKVVESEIKINKLPDEFDGYKILQLSDLHSRDFDTKLYTKINSLDYDIIVFTGDMMDDNDYDIKSFQNLIKHIDKKDIMLYIDGNNGPITYNYVSGVITPFGKKIESLGIKLLTDTYVVYKYNQKIVFSNFDIVSNSFGIGSLHGKYKYTDKLKDTLSKYSNNVKIGISHYPASENTLKYIASKKQPLFYSDLIIAGHYHGGQIRIPGYGAIFVPADDLKLSFFPKQEFVSGLVKVNNVNQYVSKGLGASQEVNILKFRLFNTPEINLLTLKK